ncbi:MAG: HEAT repeat domain-containing protein [Proteobacteria bacterium]|nr:HEAT repeat domain-containing protein [Pseudomonadota bacterium]
MNLLIDQHNYILKELIRAVKTLQLYPSGHPNLDVIMGKSYAELHKLVSEEGDIKWRIDANGFYYRNEKLMPNNIALTEISQEFFLRKVKEVTFRAELTVEELKDFMSILTIGPVALNSIGGAEVYLARKMVKGLLLNEMSYANLLKLIEEEENRDEDEEEEEILEEIEEEVEDISEEELARQNENEELKEFERLLAQLQVERDPLSYNDTAVRVIEKASYYQHLNNLSPTVRILNVFSGALAPESEIPDNLRTIAKRHLNELLTDQLLTHLIEALATEDEEERESIEKILHQAGEHTYPLLLNSLINTTDTKLRRNIYNIIVGIGEPLRAEITIRLTDERWFAVRQMVSLLGELGGKASLDTLEDMYNHHDARVKKEIMRSLARIPSDRSLAILLKGLKNKDKSIQANSIISLSILKNPASVKPLGDIVAKRDLLHENEELRKEAVKALGVIGDTAGVPYLKKALLAKSWLASGVSDGIRTFAATALGKIGGSEAVAVLEKATKQNKGNVYNACKIALEGIKR